MLEQRGSFNTYMAMESGSSGGMSDPEDLPKRKNRLLVIRGFFYYGMNHRQISIENLATIEEEMRSFIQYVDSLHNVPTAKNYLRRESFQALEADLKQIVQCLNLAMDILEVPFTLARRERLYNLYNDISELIDQVADKIK